MRIWVIEILLPVAYNDGAPVPDETMNGIRAELVERFGGLTAFTRDPAEGVWLADDRPQRDDIIVLEIMAEELDHDWWAKWRRKIERLLRQEEIVVRAREAERL